VEIAKGLCRLWAFSALLVPGAPHRAEAADIPFTVVWIDPSSPPNSWAKDAGDIDGDEDPDLFVAGAAGPIVWYHFPDWNEFVIAENCSTESGSAIGDLDGDGDLDLSLGTTWFGNPRPMGNPGGAWPLHTVGGIGNHDVAIGDLDSDGKADVVTRSETDTIVSILRQNSPSSWARLDVDPGFGLNGLALTHVDRDGHLDIVVGGIWLQNPAGNILAGSWVPHSFASWDAHAVVAIGDPNGDGRPDVLLAVSEGAGPLAWFENPGNPRTSNSWTAHSIDPGPLDHAHAIAVADMDNDGVVDVVASEYQGEGRLLVYRSADGGLTWSSQALGTPRLHNIRVEDIGRDGDLDIVGVAAIGVNPVELWRNETVPSPMQVVWYEDGDGDRHGDPSRPLTECSPPTLCSRIGDDCDDIDSTAWMIPVEVQGLRVAPSLDGSRLTWDSQSFSAGASTVYDVVTGSLEVLQSTGSFGGATCLADDQPSMPYLDARPDPGAGDGYYYTLRAVNSCDTGTYGRSSVTPDPRIELDLASPCP